MVLLYTKYQYPCLFMDDMHLHRSAIKTLPCLVDKLKFVGFVAVFAAVFPFLDCHLRYRSLIGLRNISRTSH